MILNRASKGIRFAPSPTGNFHVGNLRTAWIASEIAKLLREPLIIRFEDIDGARVVKDAQASQTADMAALGIIADHVELQSSRLHRHKALFDMALEEGRIYACDCSRTEVRDALRGIASAPHTREPEYSGNCRALARNAVPDTPLSNKPIDSIAWRWRHEDESGKYDSIVARTEIRSGVFQPGYHWACAVDDADGGYSLLIRAWDLAAAEDTQARIRCWVQNLEGPFDATRVFHTSLVTQNDGHRLEKRTPNVTLKELSALGLTSEKLLTLFRASFVMPSIDVLRGLDKIPSLLLGEAKHKISLRELGIQV